MKFCSKCGNELMDEAIICPRCGCAASQGATNDKVSIGLCILAFLIPLFGIIYWPVMHKKTPKKAQACGITGIVSWVINTIINILFIILALGL